MATITSPDKCCLSSLRRDGRWAPFSRGPSEAKRIADGEDALADLQLAGFANRQRLELVLGCIGPEHREVLVLVVINLVDVPGRLVREGDTDPVRVLDHVMVGDDPALLIPDE